MTRTSAARFLLTMQKGGGVAWLLRDEFTTDEAAPLATPRTAEPGPGTLTLVQTDGQMSISGAKLVIPAQASPAQGDLGFYVTSGQARTTGRAIFTEFTKTNNSTFYPALVVFTSAALGAPGTGQAAIIFDASGVFQVIDEGNALVLSAYAGSTSYVFAIVLRGTGAFDFILAGGTWKLVWVGTVGTTTPLYPAIINYNGVATSEYFKVRDLPTPFTTDNGIASVNVTNPISGASQTATADAITDVTFALNGSPAADEVAVRLNYRVQDADNKWTAYIKRNAGNTAWDYLVDSVSGGTPTNRITVTGVGSPTTLRAIYEGSLHDVYSFVTVTWTKRGAQVNVSHMNTETAINVEFAAGTTVSALKSFPRTSATYAELDRGL